MWTSKTQFKALHLVMGMIRVSINVSLDYHLFGISLVELCVYIAELSTMT